MLSGADPTIPVDEVCGGRNAKNKFIREIYRIKIIIIDRILYFEISGKSFIHQQIRRIIYSLIRIGLGLSFSRIILITLSWEM